MSEEWENNWKTRADLTDQDYETKNSLIRDTHSEILEVITKHNLTPTETLVLISDICVCFFMNRKLNKFKVEQVFDMIRKNYKPFLEKD